LNNYTKAFMFLEKKLDLMFWWNRRCKHIQEKNYHFSKSFYFD